MDRYRINVDNVDADAAQGFVDPTTIYQYIEAGETPANYANSLAKSRAHHRHKSIIMAIQFYSGLNVVDVVPVNSDVDAPLTRVRYIVEIENINSVSVEDETNPGTMLTGTDAVQRIVARVLTRTWTRALEVFDPTTAVARGNTTPYARTGPRVVNDTIGPVYANLTAAEAAVSVSNDAG